MLEFKLIRVSKRDPWSNRMSWYVLICSLESNEWPQCQHYERYGKKAFRITGPLSWWRHQMEAFSASLAFVRGIHRSPVNSPGKGQRGFDAFFDLRMNKRLSKQSWGWWFETQSRPLWRHCNAKGIFWWILLKRPVIRSFDISFIVSKLLNKQSSCRWFAIPPRAHGVTVM